MIIRHAHIPGPSGRPRETATAARGQAGPAAGNGRATDSEPRSLRSCNYLNHDPTTLSCPAMAPARPAAHPTRLSESALGEITASGYRRQIAGELLRMMA